MARAEAIMIADVVVEPMTLEFVVWRCLHGGPLTLDTIDQWSSSDSMPWERYRQRNRSLLTKITKTYGACAILARDKDKIVGHLRFYPKGICGLKGAGGLCLQQDHPAGPADDFDDSDFSDAALIDDETLVVHCLMTGSAEQRENPYQRKGIGTQMVRNLIAWARANGWRRIEVDSFEDIPIIYEMTGGAGHTFWEKLGFHLVDRHPHPELQDRSRYPDFIAALEEQARSMGIVPERARDQLTMCLEVT
jgi:GNAT superfamily N-acetyltransferase